MEQKKEKAARLQQQEEQPAVQMNNTQFSTFQSIARFPHENNGLKTIDAETLMTLPLPPVPYVVESILPTGLHILAGSPKTGKSWLALWICLQVAKGEPIWSFQTHKGTVLYLALEDSFGRLQNRLLDIADEAPDSLHLGIMAESLGGGLEQQIEQFLGCNSDTRLIVIDTLQKIRNAVTDITPYANDYQDIGILKSLADRHEIAILLIHHLRKMHDGDPMNMISGTTGIIGAADSTFVLVLENRGSNTAKLYCTGRDIEYRELSLKFNSGTHIWELVSDSVKEPEKKLDPVIFILSDVIKRMGAFQGTSTELLNLLQTVDDLTPGALSKRIVKNRNELAELGIQYDYHRTGNRRELSLTYDGNDNNDDNDAEPQASAVANFLSQSSHLSHLDSVNLALNSRKEKATAERSN